jgi:hypothetical protein
VLLTEDGVGITNLTGLCLGPKSGLFDFLSDRYLQRTFLRRQISVVLRLVNGYGFSIGITGFVGQSIRSQILLESFLRGRFKSESYKLNPGSDLLIIVAVLIVWRSPNDMLKQEGAIVEVVPLEKTADG